MRHDLARAALTRHLVSGHRLVTTNLVLAELQALIVRSRGAVSGVIVLDRVYSDASYAVVHADEALQEAAVDRWLRIYRDVPFSLCDAVSFEVMRREGLRQALTLDRHFSVAGYTMLPAIPKPRRNR